MRDSSIVRTQSLLMRKSIPSLVGRFSIAGFLGLCGQALQISLDGYFVGNGLGETGLSTIAVVVPLLSFATAIGCMIGVGSTSLATIALGRGETEKARSIYGASVWLGLFLGIAIAAVGRLFAGEIAQILGAPDALLAPCTDYIRRFFLFFPFIMLGCIWYYYVRLDGKPLIGTAAFTFPALYAALVEYQLIFRFGAGIESSATAFGITVGSWAFCGIHFLLSRTTLFKVKVSDIKRINAGFAKDIAVAGLASCTTQIAVALVAVNINYFLGRYGTSTDIAAFGVLNGYIIYIFSLIVTLAFAPSVQPIASLNMTAHAFGRVRQSLFVSCVLSVCSMGLITVLLLVFSTPIVSFFTGNDPSLTVAVQERLPFYVGLYSLGSMSFVVSAYYQAIESDKKAVLLSLMLNCLSLVPIMFLMTHFYGSEGIWYSIPLCDIVTFFISVLFLIRENKRLRRLSKREAGRRALG